VFGIGVGVLTDFEYDFITNKTINILNESKQQLKIKETKK